MRISSPLFFLAFAFQVSCSKEPSRDAAHKTSAATSAMTSAVASSSTSSGSPVVAEAASAGHEAYNVPGLPTSLLEGLPVPPGLGGAPAPGPGPAGAATGVGEGLNFKLPACPPVVTGVAIGTSISGTIRMPKGDMALGAAKVTLVNAVGMEQATTVSDGCGRFRFDALIPGTYKIRFQVRTFRGEQEVTVGTGGAEVDLHVEVKGLRIAVFRGAYDHVEKILDRLGVPYQIFDASQMASTDLSGYAIVFINCGSSGGADNEAVQNKLRAFVSSGGGLYVSDLSLPYILKTWPGQINASPSHGTSGIRRHTVFDLQLGSYLRGVMTVPINYNLGGWRRLEKIQPATVLPLLRDETTQEPAIVTFVHNAGLVGYTTYHQEAQMNDAMTFSLVFFITRL